MEDLPEPKNKPIYNFFLTISLIVNVILAIFSGYSAFRTSKLDDEKKKIEIERKGIETELFIEKNKPHLSTFYLVTKIDALNEFLKSKAPFPYAQQVDRYRILDNQQFEQLSSDIEKLKKNQKVDGTICFLVVVNPGEIPAYNVKLKAIRGDLIETGDIESHSALMIPIYYSQSTDPHVKIPFINTSILYDSKAAGLQQSYSMDIEAPANISWVPKLNDLRGWGRAMPEKDNAYLNNLK